METPEPIRVAYAPVAGETPEQRRRRLASKRAAKYRYFAKTDSARRAQSNDRQRRWRETLDATKRDAIREQNRKRQQVRRTKMTSDDRKKRNQQQRARRAVMDEQALLRLREREKLRMRRRRDRLSTHPPSSSSSSSASDEPARPRREALTRLSSSPLMLGMFSPPAAVSLPPATALGALRGEDREIPPPPPPPPLAGVRHHQHHHAAIEIAPLQFVLPPASSIQSLTFADRTLAPLPQVQNVLPHASTLLNAAAPPPPPPPATTQQLMPLSVASGPPGGASVSSVNNSIPQSSPSSSSAHLNSPFVLAPPSSSTSTLGSLLHPPSVISLPPHLSLQSSSQPQTMLPSLSQLPELLATASSGRDFFDPMATSATGYFPSIADFTGDFEATFRT